MFLHRFIRRYVSCINHNKKFVKWINSIKEELIKTLKDRILNNKFNKSKGNVIKQDHKSVIKKEST